MCECVCDCVGCGAGDVGVCEGGGGLYGAIPVAAPDAAGGRMGSPVATRPRGVVASLLLSIVRLLEECLKGFFKAVTRRGRDVAGPG